MKKKCLRGLRCLLINPEIYPCDLRGESHAMDKWKSERGMNFGLLQAATILIRNEAQVRIIDMEEDPGVDIIREINKFEPNLVGIGNISCYSYINTVRVIEKIKINFPEIVVYASGQNVTMATFLFENIKVKPDYLLIGYTESTLTEVSESVLTGNPLESHAGVIACKTAGAEWYKKPIPGCIDHELDDYAFLEYEIYPNWRTHLPLVEESRGCPFTCNFCGNTKVTAANKWFYRKSAQTIVDEIERVLRLWEVPGKLPIILMCSNFGTNAEDTINFLDKVSYLSERVSFMAALRVDSQWEKYADKMQPVFEQVHFGLESASHEILQRMGKTTDPQQYLDKAANAFKTFSDLGMHVGCNFIFGYPGENGRTIGETLKFLLENKHYIDSLWGGSLIEYPGCPLTDQMEEYQREFGTQRVRTSDFSDILHAYPISPSGSLNFEQVAMLSTIVMKMFNTKDTFYQHYKWYPGLLGEDYSLLGKQKFYELFLEGLKDYTSLGMDYKL